MRTFSLVAVIAAISFVPGRVHCQGLLHAPASFSPQFAELPLFSDSPWLRDDARFQQFYDAAELGSAQFVATQLELRFDGPIPAVGIPGPFTINRLIIDVGVTTNEPGTVFAQNLSQSLTRVFDASHTYLPDQDSRTPSPWGGTGGALAFPFATPVPITIPPGGFFVVDITIQGNGINGQAHAILDVAPGAGIIAAGAVANYGQGCAASAGAPDATIATSGLHSDGGAYELTGSGLGANAVTTLFIGTSDTMAPFGPLPLVLPGTSCSILTNTPLTISLQADGSGSIPAGAPSTLLRIPLASTLSGLTLFHQFASLVPGANPFNVVLSDAVSVQLGTSVPRAGGFFCAINDESSTAAYATEAREFGYAMRITTQ